MPTQYTLTQARRRLAAIVRELETEDHITLTRRGEPVAVLVSLSAYRRLTAPRMGFMEATLAWRRAVDAAGIDFDPDEVFANVRDRSPGREVDL